MKNFADRVELFNSLVCSWRNGEKIVNQLLAQTLKDTCIAVDKKEKDTLQRLVILGKPVLEKPTLNGQTLAQKIMIFGRPGGGKSTFACKLQTALNFPLHHLDKHCYESNWVERDYQEFLKVKQCIIEDESWIIDGNHTKSLEMRYSKADLVLYFNYPRWLCYIRVLKRLFSKDTTIDDRAIGCHETIDFGFLLYMWTFEERVAGQIALLREKYPNTQFVEIKSDRELEMFTCKFLKF